MRPDTFRPAFALTLLLTSALIEGSQLQLPAFQVVSIRKTASTSVLTPIRTSLTVMSGGRFEARRASIEDLARVAFGFESDPRPGVVEWRRGFTVGQPRATERARYDIAAAADREWTKPPAGESIPAELRMMLRHLLEDRFALKARVGTQRVDAYALRLSDKTRAPGPSLVPSANDCLGPFTDPPPGAEDTPRCAFRNHWEGDRFEVAGTLTMIEFARGLSGAEAGLGRPIVDDTSLEGRYDVHLLARFPKNRFLYPDEGEPVDLWPIAIREAMKSQLGLELHKTMLPIPTLVIERAKRPQEDK